VTTDALGVCSFLVNCGKPSGHDLSRCRTVLFPLVVNWRPRHSSAVGSVLLAHLARLAAEVRPSPTVKTEPWTLAVPQPVPTLVTKRNWGEWRRTVLALDAPAVCTTLALDERLGHLVPEG